MEFQEYPKALYQCDEARTVADAIEEAQARKDGFDDWKAEQVAENAAAPAARTRKLKLATESE